MNTILEVILLLIIFLNSVFLMLGKNILSFNIFKISWAIAILDILAILIFFELKQSMILYIIFTSIIVVFTIGFKNLVGNNSSDPMKNNDNKKRLANFFSYFLLFFLLLLTLGVMKNLLFDIPME